MIGKMKPALLEILRAQRERGGAEQKAEDQEQRKNSRFNSRGSFRHSDRPAWGSMPSVWLCATGKDVFHILSEIVIIDRINDMAAINIILNP